MKTVEDRLNDLETRMAQLEVKMDSLNLNFKQLLDDLKGHFDKEDERHEAIIGKLDKLDELDHLKTIVDLLKVRESNPQPTPDK